MVLMLVLARAGMRAFSWPAVRVGSRTRCLLMTMRKVAITLAGRPDVFFLLGTGSYGDALAAARTRLRVLSYIWSCSLMFFKGTLAFQSRTAALLVP